MKQQSGYVLIIVLLMLGMLMLASIRFLDRSVTNVQMSGENRRISESLLLAESAMNSLLGRFAYGADLNRDGTADNQLRIDLNEMPPTLPLPYLYYATAGNGIDQSQPSLLQAVADGEARAQGSAINDHAAAVNSLLQINSLYSGDNRPITFLQTANGLEISDQSFDSLPSHPGRAVAWLEVVRKPDDEPGVKIYVQAAAQVGDSRSYVQRYAGQYRLALGRTIPTLAEAYPGH